MDQYFIKKIHSQIRFSRGSWFPHSGRFSVSYFSLPLGISLGCMASVVCVLCLKVTVRSRKKYKYESILQCICCLHCHFEQQLRTQACFASSLFNVCTWVTLNALVLWPMSHSRSQVYVTYANSQWYCNFKVLLHFKFEFVVVVVVLSTFY